MSKRDSERVREAMNQRAEDERCVCDRLAPDGSPHVAFLVGPAEIALRLPDRSEGWLLLTVNSGRLEDAVGVVLALRSLEGQSARAAGAAAALVQQRLDGWPPAAMRNHLHGWPDALWRIFKRNLVADIASLDATSTSAEHVLSAAMDSDG